MTRPDSPWYVSAAAVHQYSSLFGFDPERDDEADFIDCENELVSIARVARFRKISEGGLLEYQGTVPVASRLMLPHREHRLVLLVSVEPRPEGKLPQLVKVKLRGRQ